MVDEKLNENNNALNEIEALLYSAIEIDQITMIESDLLGSYLKKALADSSYYDQALGRMTEYLERNSELINKALKLNRAIR